MGKLIVVTGLSGAGKSTIADKLINHQSEFGINLEKVVSFSTRPKREYEIDKQDYIFVTEEDFEELRKTGAFLELVTYAGHHYATPYFIKNMLKNGSNLVIVVDFLGALKLKELLLDHVIIIFVTVDQETVEKRLRFRGHDHDFIQNRIKRNSEDVMMFDKDQDKVDLVLVNQDLDLCGKLLVDFLKSII